MKTILPTPPSLEEFLASVPDQGMGTTSVGPVGTPGVAVGHPGVAGPVGVNKDNVIQVLRDRLEKAGVRFFANDNIGAHIQPYELVVLQQALQERVQGVLDALLIDTANDHNTKDTAKRVAKMFLTEVYKGRYLPEPGITDFPNVSNLDQLYVVGPVSVKSACSHHLVPVVGKAWVGVLPSTDVSRIIGLSKFNRLVYHYARRPQIQEEMTSALADRLNQILEPRFLIMFIKAKHMCMTWRGVEDDGTWTTTSVIRHKVDTETVDKLRNEFFHLISVDASE